MEIKVNLEQLIGCDDDEGAGSLRTQIVRAASDRFHQELKEEVKRAVSFIVTDEAKAAISEVVTGIVNGHLDAPYAERDRFGREGERMSLRNRVAVAIETALSSKSDSYGKKSLFTELVESTVKRELTAFHKEFTTLVNEEFTREAMKSAVAIIQKKFGA